MLQQVTTNTKTSHNMNLLKHLILCLGVLHTRPYVSAVSAINNFPKTVGNALDMEQDCFAPLREADTNQDQQLSNTEYVKYIQYLSDHELFKGDGLMDLPSQFVLQYNRLACDYQCQITDYEDGCRLTCADYIPIEGAYGDPSSKEKLYLYEVCDETMNTIKDALDVNNDDTDPGVTLSPSVDNTREVTIPFGVANMMSLNAFAIVDNEENSLEDVILVAFSRLKDQVQENLYVERLGGGRRKLEVRSMNSWISTVDDEPCPQSILSENPVAMCQHFAGIIEIAAIDEDADNAARQVADRAKDFIANGDFQDHVPQEHRDDYILYCINCDDSTVFPLFAIVGVAAGAVLVGLFAGRALVVNRRRRGSQLPDDDEFSTNSDFPIATPYPENMKRGIADLERGESVAVGNFSNSGRISGDESSSNAGSSGWSSSAGVSSINTGSVDSVEYFSSLAAIGAASNVPKRYVGSSKGQMYPITGGEESSQSDSSDNKGGSDFAGSPGRQQRRMISRSHLEKQIQAGDWAAVGATAAILASDSRSAGGSYSSEMSSDASLSSSGLSSALTGTSRERARAAELDRLVDAGDWDGVVLTAAKFEAESSDKDDDKTDLSVSAKSTGRSAADRSFANSSANSPSVSTNVSDTASNNLKRAEIRAEVEGLVRRVVPDEIDNIDEMMSQFHGREEELVETLRTMQERSIAARQREASRRNAKREAKKLAKEAKKATNAAAQLPPLIQRTTASKSSTPNSAEIEAFVNMSAADSSDFISIPSKGDSNITDNTPHRLALDAAIAAGDWEAVGRTAEQIAEATDESVATSDYLSANDQSSAYLSSNSREDDDRADELEGLIEEKNWLGVVDAANKYAGALSKPKRGKKSDSSEGSSSTGSGKKKSFFKKKNKSSDSDDGSTHKKKIAKEEEEARAQAQIWSAIAEQSKASGNDAIGARDAADWAISRSLKQIQDSVKAETQSVGSSNDDTSV